MKLQTLVRTRIKLPEHKNKFYSHVIKKTDIESTNYELTLLNKGLKYNLNLKQKNWIKTLTLHEQDHIRYQLAHNITRLCKQQDEKHTNDATLIKNGKNTINHIKEKLVSYRAMITKADKGIRI